jgi:hypothetical protein
MGYNQVETRQESKVYEKVIQAYLGGNGMLKLDGVSTL